MFEIIPSSVCFHIRILVAEKRQTQHVNPYTPPPKPRPREKTQYNNNQIDKDALSKVFSLLSIADLGKAAQVCKRWNHISSQDRVWQRYQQFQLHIPRPYKIHIEKLVRSLIFPYLGKIKEIPEHLPPYTALYVPAKVAEAAYWEKKSIFPQDKDNCLCVCIKDIKTRKKVLVLFALVARAFRVATGFLCVGLTKIEEAENLAKKTKIIFHNPYPFLQLEQRYTQLGLYAKAREMKKIADELKNLPIKSEPIVDLIVWPPFY